MYHLHLTPVIIFASNPLNEANKTYLLFTKEFGVVWAKAQSVRSGQSKLRCTLQDFSVGKISLVRGKETWQIIGMEPSENLYFSFGETKRFFVLARLIDFLKKMLAGEGNEEKIFIDLQQIIKLFHSLDAQNGVTTIQTAEWLFKLRTLHCLGYISNTQFAHLLQKNVWSVEFLQSIHEQKTIAAKAIDEAMSESHL
jgi:Recombinational DNA repair protein (RecF pathway)